MSSKREELKTYKELKLARGIKSRAQQTHADRTGVWVYLGERGVGRPVLRVKRQRYADVKAEITRKCLHEAIDAGMKLSVDQLTTMLAPQIENQTYDQLLLESQNAASSRGAFATLHGREPTESERAAFGEAAELAQPASQQVASLDRARGVSLDRVLDAIESKQSGNAVQLHSLWAEAVGPEFAQQSTIDRVDAANGVVYFQCANSVLSFQLSRQRNLKQKLGKQLGFVVKRLQASY